MSKRINLPVIWKKLHPYWLQFQTNCRYLWKRFNKLPRRIRIITLSLLVLLIVVLIPFCSDGIKEEGIASFYAGKFHGRLTASGIPYDMNDLTAAHRELEFGTRVEVTYLKTGKSVIVTINDRGPYVDGRIIDLSRAAAQQIGLYHDGIGIVHLNILD